MSLRTIFYFLLNWGTSKELNFRTNRNIRFTNIGILAGGINVFIFGIKNFLTDKTQVAFFELSFLPFLVFLYYLNRKHHLWATILGFILMELLFLSVSLWMYTGKNVELFFVFMAIIPNIFFTKQLINWTFFIVNLCFYYLPQVLLHSYDTHHYNYFVPASVFITFFAIIQFFVRQSDAYEKKLESQKDQLLIDKQIIENQTILLKQQDKQKTDFFINISHEFRTPLTLISGLSEKIEEIQKNNLTSKSVLSLKKIKTLVLKMTFMIDEILRLAKMGKADFKRLSSPVNLYRLASKMIGIFNVESEKKNITFKNGIPKEIHLLLDESKFESIFSNIFSNAIKFSPEETVISIFVKIDNDYVKLFIQDQGLGFPEHLDVFEKFESQSASHNLKGSGIGLSLVKELVELHDGFIEAKNLEEGALFTIYLPITLMIDDQYSFSVPEKELISITHYSSQFNILLVEDNEDMREFVGETLTDYGYKTTACSSAKEALGIMETQSFDLIVTDYMMPEMDGLEFVKHIKTMQDMSELPVIFLTAKDDTDARLQAEQVGIADYILKPFHKTELVARIDQQLNIKQNKEIYKDIESEQHTTEDELIRSFELFIKQNIQNVTLKIPEIAEHLNTTERTLYRKIKIKTGLTPNEYITDLRLKKARAILESKKHDNLKALAISLGFSSTNYFCKVYEKYFGKHPSEY